MKSTFIMLVVILAMSFSLFAQERGTSFLSFTAGLSAPAGAFAKSNAGTFDHWNNTAGFAKAGPAVGVDYTRYFSRHLGVVGAFLFSDHGGFSAKDAATLSASYTDAFAVDESTVSTHGRYRSINVLAGPVYSFVLTRKLTFDSRLEAGIIKSISTPSMTVLLEDQTVATFRQRSSTASAFAWQAGIGLCYAFSLRTGFSVRADYFSSPGVTIENDNRRNKAGRLVTKQPMQWINGLAGVYWKL